MYNQSINVCFSKGQYLRLLLTKLKTAEISDVTVCVLGANVTYKLFASLFSSHQLHGVKDQLFQPICSH